MAAPDFSKNTVDILARRARYQCSNPACGVHTVGPNSESSKATVIGEAAHIKGARPDAKRYDSAMSDAARADITNGIWLCCNCHGLIDRDEARYTVEILYGWLRAHEHRIQSELGARGTSQGISNARIQHDRDVENMRQLMGTLHIPTLQEHIADLPGMITSQALFFRDWFCAFRRSASFYVYDTVLNDVTIKIANGWQRATNYLAEYRDICHGRYIFSNPGDAPLNPNQQTVWEDIESARREMNEGLYLLLGHLRENYIEIDIAKTDADAWNFYKSC